MKWYLLALKKYCVFKGKAKRTEFWYFLLFQVIIIMILSFLERQFAIANPEIYMGKITGFYMLATFLPALAVTVRRFHDCNLSGWWVLLGIIPFIGNIIVLVLAALPSATVNRHRYKFTKRAA